MATAKKADIRFQMGNGTEIPMKDIEAAVKAQKGTVTAYVNTSESCVYCVDAKGTTTKGVLK